jgi:hypothetical protein
VSYNNRATVFVFISDPLTMDTEIRARIALDGLGHFLDPAERPYIGALAPAMLATLGAALQELEAVTPQAVQHRAPGRRSPDSVDCPAGGGAPLSQFGERRSAHPAHLR